MTSQKPKVLVVDDDPAMLRMLTKWLEAAGYVVQRAGDGRQAQAAIETDCPQLLLTDWEMPHLDGVELCRWMRQSKLPHYVHAIIVTARTTSEDMIRGLEAGADDFVKKPVDKGELLARLRAGMRVLELERRLSLMAKSDPLTGLATQRAFYEEMTREWSRVQRHHCALSCVMLDIDFFKRVNDTYGHSVGDEVIRRVANVLRASCRTSDLVGRYGGEEFCVLLPETTEKHATLWAERVRTQLAAERILVDDTELTITASFGVAERLADSESPQEVVDLADQALLVAKQSGRDRVVSYQSINASAALRSAVDHIGSIFGSLQARDVMTAVVACLREEDTIGSAVDFFLRFRLSSAPVVDGDGKLVGILSEKDALSILLWPDWRHTRIGDVMKRNVVAYPEDTSTLSIYEFLCRVAIRGVVIVREGRPVGMLGRGSLLRWFLNRTAKGTLDEINFELHGGLVREQLANTSQRLVAEAREMEQRLRGDEIELMPCVVGGASRMQELVNDLLAASRFVDSQPVHPTKAGEIRGAETISEALSAVPNVAEPRTVDHLAEDVSAWFPPGCEPLLPRV